MGRKLYIVIGCDTDPDREGYVGKIPENTLSWRGMLEGSLALKDSLQKVTDSRGVSPVISWCLRADYQIKKTYGSYGHILSEHKQFFLDLETSGDELSWHPHFWNYDEEQKCWYQDFLNREWQLEMLEKAHADYQQHLPGRAKSVRMGWDYHNNETIAKLDQLSVEVDFSGIPGLKLDPKNDQARAANFFDWYLTPNHPYFPSRNDYRREARDAEQTLGILESPNFVSKSLMWSMVRGFALGLKMKDPIQVLRALIRPSYWIGITGKPRYFIPVVSQLKRIPAEQSNVVFVSYFHPDELIENNSTLYSLANMKENIKTLVSKADRLGFETRFVRARDIPDLIQ